MRHRPRYIVDMLYNHYRYFPSLRHPSPQSLVQPDQEPPFYFCRIFDIPLGDITILSMITIPTRSLNYWISRARFPAFLIPLYFLYMTQSRLILPLILHQYLLGCAEKCGIMSRSGILASVQFFVSFRLSRSTEALNLGGEWAISHCTSRPRF